MTEGEKEEYKKLSKRNEDNCPIDNTRLTERNCKMCRFRASSFYPSIIRDGVVCSFPNVYSEITDIETTSVEKENQDMTQTATFSKQESVILILISIGVIYGIYSFINAWPEQGMLRCVSSTSEIVIFQTGPLSPILEILFSGFLVSVMLSILLLNIKDWQDKKKTSKKIDFWLIAMSVFAIFLFSFFLLNSVYLSPSSERFVIDKSNEVIILEKHYLLRNEMCFQIPFDEIDHVEYHYFRGDPPEESPFGRVDIIKPDGTKIYVSGSNDCTARQYLAEAISDIAEKELVRENHPF